MIKKIEDIKEPKHIAALLRNYKRNKARLRILELSLVDDEDYLIGAIDYSKDNVQTSSLSSLDNKILAREEEAKNLKMAITITEALLGSLDKRKDCQYEKLINNYYIENMTQSEVMGKINIYDNRYFFELCNKALNSLFELVKDLA